MTNFYDKPSRFLLFRSQFMSLLFTDSLKRISQKNLLHDYKIMIGQSDTPLWNLHKRLEYIRNMEREQYDSYDYGSGYYYQSMKSINISGYRNTELRIKELDLSKRLKGKSVLDIGSNTGFLLLSLADSISCGVGVEFNSYLVDTSNAVKHYMNVNNVDFISSSFKQYKTPAKKFDAVLSLANHSTYDGNTDQSIGDYFLKISNILSKNGILLFESHPPEIEPPDKLENTLNIIKEQFNVTEILKINMVGFLDRNRTYLVASSR